MAIVSKDDLLTSLKTKLGEDTADDTISIIENITDTLTDLETKASDTTNWQQKYEENDKEWRTKYTERFYSPNNPSPEDNPVINPEPKIKKPITFDDLFKVKE